MNLKNKINNLNKREILSTIQLLTILICSIVIVSLYAHKHAQLEDQKELNAKLHNHIVQLKVEHEEGLAASDVTIQNLTQSNLKLNNEKQDLQNEVDELNKVIKIIAEKLKMETLELLNNPKSVSRGGGDNWQTFQMTHYQAFCKSGCNGITATGLNVKNTIYHQNMRVIAVDPKVIPLHSIVEVRREDGTTFKAIAQDTGGRIKGQIIDLLVTDTETAIEEGRQNVQLRITKRGE